MTRAERRTATLNAMKKLMLFTMWLAASAAAVGVAWAGVSVVDNQVVAPPAAADALVFDDECWGPVGRGAGGRPSIDPAVGIHAHAHGRAVDDSHADCRTGVCNTGDRSDADFTYISVYQSTDRLAGREPDESIRALAGRRSDESARARPTRTPRPRPTPTTRPSAQPTASPSPPPAPTAQPAPAAITQTFTLTGGTAAISFSATGVQVLWATPNPGFEVRIEPESSGIKVEFRADHHRSRVDAWWSGGPQHSIREEPRD